MIEFRQVAGILCPMKLMKNIRNGAINHSKLRFQKGKFMIKKGTEFLPYYMQMIIKYSGGIGFESYRK